MFWKKKQSKLTNPKTPLNTRIYAIGDIHGCYDLLQKMHQIIIKDAEQHQSKNKIIIYIGDYIDRGYKSKEVVDSLISDSLPNFKKVFLKGNHEDAMLAFLKNPDRIGPAWLTYGGEATLISYGVNIRDKNGKKRSHQELSAELEISIPQGHQDFYNNLQLTHTEQDYLFVHAGIKPGVKIEKQKTEDLLTIRQEFVISKKHFTKKIVFGHTIFQTPQNQKNKIAIDTGAYASGNLSCAVLDGEDVDFLTASRGD